MNNKEELFESLREISEDMEKTRILYEAENDKWWNNLTKKEREDAFYAVVKRIVIGELKDRGTYRYVLYNVFGFDEAMYFSGMDCGYMNLHNSIMND
jgi:hypothetical protein